MKNKLFSTLLFGAAALAECASQVQPSNNKVNKSSVAKAPDNKYVSSCNYPTGVLGMRPTRAFEEVYMKIAAIIDSFEKGDCQYYFKEVEDLLDNLGYEYTYEVDAFCEYDRWIIVKDPEANAEIRIYGCYDEYDNVDVSGDNIIYDLTCIEYQSGQYYGITDMPNLIGESCKHGVDTSHKVSASYGYANISRPENSITNVGSTEAVRRFFFITE